MSKPRSSKVEKSNSDRQRPKSTLSFYYKNEKRDNVTNEVTDDQYIIGATGIKIKYFKKKGESSDKIAISSLPLNSAPSGKYQLLIFKNGNKEKESEHSLEEIKKYLAKTKVFSFFDKIDKLK